MDALQNPDSNPELIEQAPPEKAQSPWMIGILLLSFGFLGLFTVGMIFYLGANDLGGFRGNWLSKGLTIEYVYFSFVVKVFIAVWMMVIGGGLLGFKEWSRRHFNAFYLFFVVWTFGNYAYQYLQIPPGFSGRAIASDLLTDVLGNLVILAILTLCRYALNKEKTKAWLK